MKTILITGASSGIGLAAALRFAKDGHNLVLCARSPDKLTAAEGQVKAAGATAILAIPTDVGDEAAVAAAFQKTTATFGGVDVVVNNAGEMRFAKLEEFTGQDWLHTLTVDLLGAFFFTKQLFLQGRAGSNIVNVASIHAIETTPMVAPYAAAKAALLSLTRSTAMEGKPKGIRANVVLPGAIDTPMLWENPNLKAGIEKLDKADVGEPEDVAAAIAWLASDEARFVTGASLLVDGGRLARL